jgi:putative transposase
MRTAKGQDADYIDFLIASPKLVTCLEAAQVQPSAHVPPAHDTFTRLLLRLEPDPETLGREAKPLVENGHGVLVLGDSTPDKPSAKKIESVARHWSGKHKAVVWGINPITLVWTDGDRKIPCDYRLDDKDGLTKNDHFRAMLHAARDRGFAPECVLFDSWYGRLEDLKAVRGVG